MILADCQLIEGGGWGVGGGVRAGRREQGCLFEGSRVREEGRENRRGLGGLQMSIEVNDGSVLGAGFGIKGK